MKKNHKQRGSDEARRGGKKDTAKTGKNFRVAEAGVARITYLLSLVTACDTQATVGELARHMQNIRRYCCARKMKSVIARLLKLHEPAPCPRCGATALRFSRRHGLIDALLLAGFAIVPYRCRICNLRYRAPRVALQQQSG